MGEPFELERYRNYLKLLARQQIGIQYRGKFDSSDIVQETLLSAHEMSDQMRNLTENERLALLRKILANRLIDDVRKFGREKRNVKRERRLHTALDEASDAMERQLTADQLGPSDEAVRHEELLRLADAVATLSENQQIAIELHHLEGLTLKETAQEMQTTEASAAGLVRRAMKKLRQRLRND